MAGSKKTNMSSSSSTEKQKFGPAAGPSAKNVIGSSVLPRLPGSLQAQKRSFDESLEEIKSLVVHKRTLQREKAIRDLQSLLRTPDAGTPESSSKIETLISSLCAGTAGANWEGKHGGLMALIAYIEFKHKQAQTKATGLDAFVNSNVPVVLGLLADDEVRVRLAAGDAVGSVCLAQGVKGYKMLLEDKILENIEANLYLERDDLVDETEEGKVLKEKLQAGEAARLEKQPGGVAVADNKSMAGSMASSQRSSIYHDTAGWKTLETDMRALQRAIEACKTSFAPHAKHELLDLVCQCSLHINRYVRGISFQIFSALFEALGTSGWAAFKPALDQSDLVSRLISGLADEWPEVRMDACIAARRFFSFVPQENHMQYFEGILPRLCINRYFAAEGVRTYSHMTWRQVVGQQGAELVAKFVRSFVEFYISQTQVLNQEMREAACLCIGEVAAKISREAVLPFATDLLAAVLSMIEGKGSWTVRNAACLALGKIFESFPDEAKPRAAETINLLFKNNSDDVWSLRECSGDAIAQVVKRYDQDFLPETVERVLAGLQAVSKQPSDYQLFKVENEDVVTLKKKRDNDLALHSNQGMFDCCSVGDIPDEVHDHHDHDHKHVHKDWQITDGCFYSVRALAAFDLTLAEKALPLMADAVRHKHYIKHFVLLETLWAILPDIAEHMGKKNFKRYLELFFDAMVYTLRDEDRDSQTAGDACVRCITKLCEFLGVMIFHGRVEQYDPAFVSVMHKRVPAMLAAATSDA